MNITSEDYQNFYAAIGKGITLWAEIESKLSLIYSYLVFDTSQTAQDSFYSVGTFKAKLKLVDVATRGGFMRMQNISMSTPRIKTWNNLKNRLTKHSDDRNKLAHYRVTLFANPIDLAQSQGANHIDVSKLNYELRLCRPHIPSIKPTQEGAEEFSKQLNDSLSLVQINAHINNVSNILTELNSFTEPLFYELGKARLKQINEFSMQISDNHLSSLDEAKK